MAAKDDVDKVMALVDQYVKRVAAIASGARPINGLSFREHLRAEVERIVADSNRLDELWRDACKNQEVAVSTTLGWAPIECPVCDFKGAKEMDNWRILKERAEKAEAHIAELEAKLEKAVAFFERQHADGHVWITTVGAAASIRAAIQEQP